MRRVRGRLAPLACRLSVGLTLLALGSPPLAQAQDIRIAGLTVLRTTLPPADTAALDGGGMFECPPPQGPLDQLLFERLLGQGANLSCGNTFETLLEFPGEGTPYGAYQSLADRIRAAKKSVLLANMVWDTGERTPGQLLAAALADLRRNVLSHPEQYPHGMQVRILLGNSVRPDRPLDSRANLDYAALDLLRAGLRLDGVAEGGWHLEVANFHYAVPHSHLKLAVFDEAVVVAGGFNISTLHLPTSSGGAGHHDLGLVVRGPVALHAAAAFADSWQLSDRLTCPPGVLARRNTDLWEACSLGGATTPITLEPLAQVQQDGAARVYPLYRRSGYQAADDTLVALLGAAQSSIDLLQAQVSGDLYCDLTLGTPGSCRMDEHGLPVWQQVASALRRGVKVRMVLDQDYPMKFEAAALVRSLQDAVKDTPGQQNLEIRWVRTPMHTKAIVIDRQMALVGSTNLHFSSFGAGGLNEYALATSDPGALARVEDVFEREWQAAQPFTFPWWAQ